MNGSELCCKLANEKFTFPLLRSRGERSVSLFCASHGIVFLSGNVYNIPQELLVLAVIKVHSLLISALKEEQKTNKTAAQKCIDSCWADIDTDTKLFLKYNDNKNCDYINCFLFGGNQALRFELKLIYKVKFIMEDGRTPIAPQINQSTHVQRTAALATKLYVFSGQWRL